MSSTRAAGAWRHLWQQHAWLLVNLFFPLFPAGIYLLMRRGTMNLFELSAALVVYFVPACWAWWLAQAARRALRAEEDLLRTVERNGQALQAQLDRHSEKFTIDSEFWTRFVPDMHAQGPVTLTSVRMVQSLCHEAVSGRFPPISTTTQIYAAEIMERARRLRAPQTLAMRLGILGTFVGLLLALAKLSEIYSAPVHSSKEVLHLIDNIQVAFFTSVAGLLAAILVQFFGEALNVNYARVTKQIEDTVGRVVTVLSSALTGSHLVRTAAALTERMDEHRRELVDHADNVQQATQKSLAAAEHHVDSLKAGIEGLNSSQCALSTLITNHNGVMEQLRGGLDRLARTDERLENTLQANLEALRGATQGAADAGVRAVREVLAPVGQALAQQNERATASVDVLSRTAESIQSLSRTLSSVAEALERQGEKHAAMMNALGELARQRQQPIPSPARWPQRTLWVTVMGVFLLHMALALYVFRDVWTGWWGGH